MRSGNHSSPRPVERAVAQDGGHFGKPALKSWKGTLRVNLTVGYFTALTNYS